jgi:plasmid maintenance system antidote protein VapI
MSTKHETNRESALGSSFDEFLKGEGLLKESTLAAAKRVLGMQIAREMKRQNLTKSQMARHMHTSRASLDRLLDPENESVTLQTMDKAARSLGRRIAVALI